MAGHSKWANIKHRKAKEDAKRGKVFTKLIRELTIAAKMGGGDPGSNPRLRAAIDAAFASNMTRDTVDRAVKRGAGGLEGQDVEEITYEGYAHGGVAVIVECMTNNRNRTVGEVRHAFSKCGGNLGTDGSVAYQFSRKGVLSFAPGADEQVLLELALDAGADDLVTQDDGSIEIYTSFEQFSAVKAALIEHKFEPDSAEVTMISANMVDVDGEDVAKVVKLLDMLEDLDDVQKVYSNANFNEDDLALL